MTSNPSNLSVSIVFYNTALDVVQSTIQSLSAAIELAKNEGSFTFHTLYLINNNEALSQVFNLVCAYAKNLGINTVVKTGHGNVGYGIGNNLAIFETEADYHLILNPDVIIDPQALNIGIAYLDANKNVDLVAPHATNKKGDIEYLAKRMPTPFVILLRGLNRKFLNKFFERKLDYYTYKDKIPCNDPFKIELASGCFMLCRTSSLKSISGFSPKYFLYFEDFDLTARLALKVLLPSMKIIHAGGNTAKKGLTHIKLFMKSAAVFFLKGK